MSGPFLVINILSTCKIKYVHTSVCYFDMVCCSSFGSLLCNCHPTSNNNTQSCVLWFKKCVTVTENKFDTPISNKRYFIALIPVVVSQTVSSTSCGVHIKSGLHYQRIERKYLHAIKACQLQLHNTIFHYNQVKQ